MKKNIIIIALLVLVGVGIAWAAGGTSVLSQGELDNSETYYGTQRFIDSDTTNVNQFVIVAIGPVHAVVKIRVYAAGKWSGWARIDSFATTGGTVRLVSGITTDSLMRIWLPPLDFVADTNKIAARSYLKQTTKYFQWQVYVETQSSGNSGALDVTWID